MTLTCVIAAWYFFVSVVVYFSLLRRELPPRSAVVFSVLWPLPAAALSINQLNAWTEAAFTWAVERLD